MLKPIDLPIILSNEDYIELMGAPNKDFKEEDYLILNKWIGQATDQIDSMISAYNESGYLYRFWKSLKDNDEDNAKGYKLQLAIAKWVECMIISGKFWVDNLPTMSSNIQYDINSSSNDSNIEAKRKDIIKDLSSIGLLQTSNILDTNNNQINNQEVEELILLSKEYLNNNFLALDSASRGQVIQSPINLANNALNLAGDIQGVTVNGAKHTISNYRLKNCTLEDVTIENANKILDNKDGLYKFIEEFPISTWEGLTAQEIFNLIQGYSGIWKPQFPYQIGSMTWGNVEANGNIIALYVSLVENNVGNEPRLNPTMWEIKNFIIDVKDIVKEVIKQSQPLNAIEIKKQLDALPTIDNIIYPKNIAHNFTTKALFDLAKEEYKIQDTDYIVEENGTIFGHGENGEVVGDGMFKAYNLPKDMKMHILGYTMFRNTPENCSVRDVLGYGGVLVHKTSGTLQWGGLIGMGNENWPYITYSIFLNGDVTQQQYKPQYTQKYMVTFNKDIIKKSVVKVENAEVSFKDIKGVLTDNTSAYNLLDWMNSGFRQIDAGEDGLLKTDFTLRNVSKLNGFDNNFSYTMSNSQNALKLNYNIKDGVEVWTGNYLNGKEIYINKITANVSAGTETFIFHNVEDIVSINAFLTIGNTRKMLTGISQVDDAIAIKSMEDGDVVLTITYTKRNGN